MQIFEKNAQSRHKSAVSSRGKISHLKVFSTLLPASPKPSQYRLLDQKDLSDSDLSDDEEEQVIFRKPGDLELNLYPKIRSKKTSNSCAQCQKICGIVLFVAMVTTVVVVLIVRHGHQQPGPETNKPLDWELILDDFITENGLVLLDVDGDHQDDLIFSVMHSEVWNDLTDNDEETQTFGYQYLHSFCQNRGLDYPCGAVVMALRGYDGKELWRLNIRTGMFNLNCEEFDLDQDGRPDCIGTGRVGVITAFNPYTGKEIWSVENDTYFKAKWNTYQALPLPDFDQDGVLEVLIANGGDPSLEPEDMDRNSGRLVILSGATGTPLGNSFLELPGNKETYMSPILYQQTNGSTPYILIGSGGETIAGDLLGISVADLCRAILGSTPTAVCPSSGDLPWKQLTKDDQGLFVIYKGERKGAMVPPVIVDVDHDGIMDIVASVYDGAVLLLDGKTMQQKWKAEFPNMESYSTPAPGYFDEDNILDFMVHWNRGTWDNGGYNETIVAVISGKTGERLWQSMSLDGIHTSDLVIRGNHSNHDFFLFRQTLQVPDEKHDQRHKRQGFGSHIPQQQGEEFPWSHDDFLVDCQRQPSPLSQQMLMLDRSTMATPLKILDLPVKEFYYEPITEDGDKKTSVDADVTGTQAHHVEQHKTTDGSGEAGEPNQRGPQTDGIRKPVRAVDDEQSSIYHNVHSRSQKKFCAFLKPFGGSTGALGDVDGDGMLDYVNIIYNSGTVMNYHSSTLKIQTVINMVALEKHWKLGDFETVNINSTFTPSDVDKGESLAFLPPKQQKWTKYMGTLGNNWYL